MNDIAVITTIIDSVDKTSGVPVRMYFTSEEECRCVHRGLWFDPETLRFFGSRNRHFHRPGIMVETQLNAPLPELRYATTVWTRCVQAGTSPITLERFGSLSAARRFAELADAAWSHALTGLFIRSLGRSETAGELARAAVRVGVMSPSTRDLALALMGLGDGGSIDDCLAAAEALTVAQP